MEHNTIKGHGFAIGDRVDFYGLAKTGALPTAEPTRCKLGKVGNKYMLTSITGELDTWEFGATAKLWAAPVADDSDNVEVKETTLDNGDTVYTATCEHGWATGFYTVAEDATKVARGHGTVSLPMYEAPEPVTAYDAVTASDMATAVGVVRRNGRVFTAEAHNFAPDQAFIRAVEAGDLTVIYDLCSDMNRYVLAGHEPVNVVRIAPNIVRVVVPTAEIHTDSEVITEAEVWAGTDTTITPGAKTLMNRRARKSSKRKNTRVNSRRVRGGF